MERDVFVGVFGVTKHTHGPIYLAPATESSSLAAVLTSAPAKPSRFNLP